MVAVSNGTPAGANAKRSSPVRQLAALIGEPPVYFAHLPACWDTSVPMLDDARVGELTLLEVHDDGRLDYIANFCAGLGWCVVVGPDGAGMTEPHVAHNQLRILRDRAAHGELRPPKGYRRPWAVNADELLRVPHNYCPFPRKRKAYAS